MQFIRINPFGLRISWRKNACDIIAAEVAATKKLIENVMLIRE